MVLALETKEMPKSWCLDKKNVIFAVDVSTSMLDTMTSLKASLLTFRDLMCGRTSSKQPPVTDEQFRAALPNFHLITFSDEAVLKWSNTPRDGGLAKQGAMTFDELVNSLEVKVSTNMGAALELAYSLCPQGGFRVLQGVDARASWIAVLTDGESNVGKHQSVEAFAQLASRKPPNSRIISLGYGRDFDISTLDVIGDFTHLQNEESIPGFMGALVHEISTCGVINVEVEFPQRQEEEPKNIVIGSQNVGWFANERKYHFGFIGHHDPPKTGEVIFLHYAEIREDGIWRNRISQPVPNKLASKTLSPEMRAAIASSQASKMIKELYACHDRDLSAKIEQILSIVEKWTDEGMAEARETVRRVCKDAMIPRETASASFQLANSLQQQTSYVDPFFQSPTSLTSAQRAMDLCTSYLKTK